MHEALHNQTKGLQILISELKGSLGKLEPPDFSCLHLWQLVLISTSQLTSYTILFLHTCEILLITVSLISLTRSLSKFDIN